jgi:hypothetical protein
VAGAGGDPYNTLGAGAIPECNYYRAACPRHRRVLIRIHIERVGPLRQG